MSGTCKIKCFNFTHIFVIYNVYCIHNMRLICVFNISRFSYIYHMSHIPILKIIIIDDAVPTTWTPPVPPLEHLELEKDFAME